MSLDLHKPSLKVATHILTITRLQAVRRAASTATPLPGKPLPRSTKMQMSRGQSSRIRITSTTILLPGLVSSKTPQNPPICTNKGSLDKVWTTSTPEQRTALCPPSHTSLVHLNSLSILRIPLGTVHGYKGKLLMPSRKVLHMPKPLSSSPTTRPEDGETTSHLTIPHLAHQANGSKIPMV